MKIQLIQDYIIPKGTIFENIDGETRKYVSGKYSTILWPSKDTTMDIVIDDVVLEDRPDIFKII